jgi:ferric-dicitrate binding protein FerR (iron transport regulator)
MENNLLIKFVTGQCSESEKEEVVQALLQDEALQKEYITIKNVWSLTRSVDTKDSTDYNKEYQRIKRKINKSRIKVILKYAAVFIAVLCTGGILTNQFLSKDLATTESKNNGLETKFVVPFGQTAELHLPDGTLVWMNSGTALTYSADFSPSNRIITLDGEAFFAVKKDAAHPFLVKTAAINIKVLGTSFNVEAYNDNLHQVNTTLVNGKVEIDNIDNQKLADLLPGQIGRFSEQNGKLNVTKIDTSFYTSWKEGFIMFNNTPLGEIALKMERWYNVKFIFRNQQLKNVHYSGTILRGKPIDQILEIMKITANINYKIVIKNNSPNIIYLE